MRFVANYLGECPRKDAAPLLGLGGSSSRVGWDPPYQVRPKEGGDLVDDYRRSLVEVASS